MKLNSVLFSTYKRIAENSFLQAKELYNSSIHEQAEIDAELPDYTIPCIVFSALYAESYINHLVFSCLDKSMFNYLDKLDLVGKWLIVPKLINGSEFPKSNHIFELLKGTIKTRNKLVHSKTDAFDYTHPSIECEEIKNKYTNLYPDFEDAIKDAFNSDGKLIDDKPQYLLEYQKECLSAYHKELSNLQGHCPTYFKEAANSIKLIDELIQFAKENHL